MKNSESFLLSSTLQSQAKTPSQSRNIKRRQRLLHHGIHSFSTQLFHRRLLAKENEAQKNRWTLQLETVPVFGEKKVKPQPSRHNFQPTNLQK